MFVFASVIVNKRLIYPGGVDYNNYFPYCGSTRYYYNRGGSPLSENAMMVGNMDSLKTSRD